MANFLLHMDSLKFESYEMDRKWLSRRNVMEMTIWWGFGKLRTLSWNVNKTAVYDKNSRPIFVADEREENS